MDEEIYTRYENIAESKLRRKPPEIKDIEKLSYDEIAALIHDLHVHQIELEIQNEELRSTQVELERLRERYWNLYNLAPVAYMSIDEFGSIYEVNLAASKLFACPKKVLLNMPLTSFVDLLDRDLLSAIIEKARKSNADQTFETKMRRANGDEFYAYIEINASKDGHGEKNGFQIAILDFTERKEAELALLRLNQQLEQRRNSE